MNELERAVRDERWGIFWLLRAIKVDREIRWQVWDFTNVWYPTLQAKDKLVVADADSPEAAAQAALSTRSLNR